MLEKLLCQRCINEVSDLDALLIICIVSNVILRFTGRAKLLKSTDSVATLTCVVGDLSTSCIVSEAPTKCVCV